MALLMNTSSKKVPSKLSQTAITEGEDILASMMDSDSSGDDFEMPAKTVCKPLIIETSQSDTRTVYIADPQTRYVSDRVSDSVSDRVSARVSSARMFDKTGTIASIEAVSRKNVGIKAPASSSSPSLYRPPAIPLSRSAISPPLVTLQGGAVITRPAESVKQKHAPTISHVSIPSCSTSSNTRARQPMSTNANHNIASNLQDDTRHVSVREPAAPVQADAAADAAAWLPGKWSTILIEIVF